MASKFFARKKKSICKHFSFKYSYVPTEQKDKNMPLSKLCETHRLLWVWSTVMPCTQRTRSTDCSMHGLLSLDHRHYYWGKKALSSLCSDLPLIVVCYLLHCLWKKKMKFNSLSNQPFILLTTGKKFDIPCSRCLDTKQIATLGVHI